MQLEKISLELLTLQEYTSKLILEVEKGELTEVQFFAKVEKYTRFLNQELNESMFIGENAIFEGFDKPKKHYQSQRYQDTPNPDNYFDNGIRSRVLEIDNHDFIYGIDYVIESESKGFTFYSKNMRTELFYIFKTKTLNDLAELTKNIKIRLK